MTTRIAWLAPWLLLACGGNDYKTQPDGGGGGTPTVTATATPTSGTAPLDVAFHCDGAGGDAPLQYVWDFGDGTQSTLQNPSHTYTAAGSFTAMCEVQDANGDSANASVTITADAAIHAPKAQIDVVGSSKPSCAVTGQTTVQLSAANSTDPDNDTLWYEWALISAPAGSSAQLSSTVGTMPTLRPDIDGTYVVRLHVEDPSGLSDNVDLSIASESASQVVTISGDNQMVGDGGPLAMPVVVEVETACGLGVSGQTVTFSAANGTASPASGISDSSGQVATSVTAGCALGSSALTATLGSTAVTDSISFSTEIGAAYAVVLSKPTNTPVPGPMIVHAEVHDRCCNLIATDNTTAFTLAITEATAAASAQFAAVTTGTALDPTHPEARV